MAVKANMYVNIVVRVGKDGNSLPVFGHIKNVKIL